MRSELQHFAVWSLELNIFIFVEESSLSTNITENKLAQLDNDPELLKQQKVGKKVVMNVINEEAENFAVQHRLNKLKQHHRRAFELISRALKIDEEVGNKDERTVELYKKGKKYLQMLLILTLNLALTLLNISVAIQCECRKLY